jgi:hypothetical protein
MSAAAAVQRPEFEGPSHRRLYDLGLCAADVFDDGIGPFGLQSLAQARFERVDTLRHVVCNDRHANAPTLGNRLSRQEGVNTT